MSEEKKFLKKEERKLCWGAKDEFWACMDKVNGDAQAPECKDFRSKYEALCPQSWVVHFDRKYHFEKFKQKLKTEGYQKIDEENSRRRKASS